MKTLRLRPLIIALAAVVLLAGCKGDDGAVGPAGANGTNGKDGANGTNGTNGTNGANGAGFDDAIKKGNIVIYLDGKRPDGEAFKDTLNFSFSSPDVDENSYIQRYMAPSDSNNYAYVERFLGYNNTYNDDYPGVAGVDSQVRVEDNGDSTRYIYLWIETPIIFESEHLYFNMDNYFEFSEFGDYANVSDSTLTNYSYSSSTGSLKYKTSFVSAAGNNSTGYELKVTAEVNTIVYEQIVEEAAAEEPVRKRAKAASRLINGKVPVAQMKPWFK